MTRKTKGKTARMVKTVRIEKEEFEKIIEKFGSFRKMIDAVINKIKEKELLK